MLRLPKKKDNILMRNLFVILRCKEIVALSHLLTIIFLSVCIPLRWLAAKTVDLAEYQWGAVNMGLVLDVWLEHLKTLKTNPSHVLNEKFMMGMFSEFCDQLPPMQEYMTTIFKQYLHKSICRHTGATIVRLIDVRDKPFNPKNNTNKRCDARVIELGAIAWETMYNEMVDPKKATHRYLSMYGLPSLWIGYSWEIKTINVEGGSYQ